MGQSMLNVMANSGPEPAAIHAAAHQKAMQDAGYVNDGANGWVPRQSQQAAPQPTPAPQQTVPQAPPQAAPVATPDQSPSLRSTIETGMAGQPEQNAVAPSTQLPGQLPQQAGLTQPSALQQQQQQYQYDPMQTQTVLDTLRRGAQIQ